MGYESEMTQFLRDLKRKNPQIAELQTRGVNVAFGFGPEVGRHDASRYVAGVYQGGLGLPDRDFYF